MTTCSTFRSGADKSRCETPTTLDMSRLTPAVLLAAAPAALTPGRDETAAALLRRVPLLALQERELVAIDGVELCANLVVLSAGRNALTTLPPGLTHLPKLEVLDVDDNALELLHLDGCGAALRRLSAARNALRGLAGLSACVGLRELYLDAQRRPGGAPLALDPASLAAVAPTLRRLGLRGNGVADVAPLALLGRLEWIDLRDNAVADASALEACVRAWPALEWIDTRGNPCADPGEGGDGARPVRPAAPSHTPVTSGSAYRDRLVAAAGARLLHIDGVDLTALTSAWIRLLHARRAARAAAQRERAAPDTALDDATHSHDNSSGAGATRDGCIGGVPAIAAGGIPRACAASGGGATTTARGAPSVVPALTSQRSLHAAGMRSGGLGSSAGSGGAGTAGVMWGHAGEGAGGGDARGGPGARAHAQHKAVPAAGAAARHATASRPGQGVPAPFGAAAAAAAVAATGIE